MREEYFVCCTQGSFHRCNTEPQAVDAAKALIRFSGSGHGVKVLKTIYREGEGPLSDFQVFLATRQLRRR